MCSAGGNEHKDNTLRRIRRREHGLHSWVQIVCYSNLIRLLLGL
jgi:hypothetical protein